jgi:hypothetical protein
MKTLNKPKKKIKLKKKYFKTVVIGSFFLFNSEKAISKCQEDSDCNPWQICHALTKDCVTYP